MGRGRCARGFFSRAALPGKAAPNDEARDRIGIRVHPTFRETRPPADPQPGGPSLLSFPGSLFFALFFPLFLHRLYQSLRFS